MRSTGSLVQIGLLAAACLTTVGGTRVYRSFAIRRGIVAPPNFRSLHERPLPRGGGIVFSMVCLGAVIGLSFTGSVDPRLLRALVVGGVVATVFGFVDDARQVGPALKLFAQMALAGWILVCFDGASVIDVMLTPHWLDVAVSWLAVWLMNLYNFIDGIDGLAALGAVSMSSIAIVILLERSRAECGPPLAAPRSAIPGFVFNWPPASIFMRLGSLFLGFCFGTLIAATMIRATSASGRGSSFRLFRGRYDDDDAGADVRGRQVVRRAPKSLTRIWRGCGKPLESGQRRVYLPPAVAPSARRLVGLAPSVGPVAAALALAPVVCWTLRYGPLLSVPESCLPKLWRSSC